MINAEINICPRFGWVGGPQFSTRIETLRSGQERRNAQAAYPRHHYTLPLVLVDAETIMHLKSVYMAAQGQLRSFLAHDFSDDMLDGYTGTADGETTEFKLIKRYSFGENYFDRLISKPLKDVQIFIDGNSASATVDTKTGIIKFPSPPAKGAVITAKGPFRVPVRFDNDALSTTISNKTGNHNYVVDATVDLIEVFE